MATYTLTPHQVYHIPTGEFMEMLIGDRPDWDEAIDADDEGEMQGSAWLLAPEDCPEDLAETFEMNGLVYQGTRMDGYDPDAHLELFDREDHLWWRGFPKQKKALFIDRPENVRALFARLGL